MPSSQAKVVAITGGGRGIGLATARAFARAGAKVSIADIDGDAAALAAESIGNTHAARLDVTGRAGFERYVAECQHAGPPPRAHPERGVGGRRSDVGFVTRASAGSAPTTPFSTSTSTR